MPIGVERVVTTDLTPSQGVGVAIPFEGKAVFNTTYTTREAIKTNIINLFSTQPGERFLNPEFGTPAIRIIQNLFENINETLLENLKDIVEDSFQRYFPGVILTRVNTFSEREHYVRIEIKYKIREGVEEETLQLDFQ